MVPTKCKTALVEAALCITHADDQMLVIYRVLGQMAENTTCGIAHHARRTRAHDIKYLETTRLQNKM